MEEIGAESVQGSAQVAPFEGRRRPYALTLCRFKPVEGSDGSVQQSLHSLAESVVRGANLTAARYPDPAALLREAASLLHLVPAPRVLAAGGETLRDEDATHEMQERRVQEAVERAHDTF